MLSMMDRLWKPDLSEAEALELMHRGIDEVRSLHTWVKRSMSGVLSGELSWHGASVPDNVSIPGCVLLAHKFLKYVW